MEDNKYYTPLLEEFFVGFECEILSSYGWQKGVYPKILSMDTLSFQDMIDTCETAAIERASIRVKYLDKSDIESLGWKEEFINSRFIFTKDDWELYTYGLLKLDSSIEEGLIFKNTKANLEKQEHIIKIMIKNKSELKKLMKQLGI